VLLEIDLQHLVYWDSFVGENFIRCVFRYYPCLSNYVREVFLLRLEEDQLMLRCGNHQLTKNDNIKAALKSMTCGGDKSVK
jgi:hypothetical protein